MTPKELVDRYRHNPERLERNLLVELRHEQVMVESKTDGSLASTFI